MEIKDYHADHSKKLKHMLWKKASWNICQNGEPSSADLQAIVRGGQKAVLWMETHKEYKCVNSLFFINGSRPKWEAKEKRLGFDCVSTFMRVLKPEIVSRVHVRGKRGRQRVQDRLSKKERPFSLLV